VRELKWFLRKEPDGELSESLLACTRYGRILQINKNKSGNVSEIMRVRSPTERILHLRPGGGASNYALNNNLSDPLGKQALDPSLADNGTNKAQNEVSGASMLSKLSSLLCLDVCKNLSAGYLVGTNEGLIHECLITNTEAQLDTKYAHTHPLRKIKYSPNSCQTFASCGGNKVCIWQIGNPKPLLTLKFDNASEICDINWCPTQKGCFMVLTPETLSIFDFVTDINEPKINLEAFNCRFTCAEFHPTEDLFFVCNDDGRISMYQLFSNSTNSRKDFDDLSDILNKKAS